MNLTSRFLYHRYLGFLFAIPAIIFSIDIIPAQAQEIEPTYISISDGLVNPNVQDVIQDSYGLLWVATSNGLQQYDGYSFETYKHIPGKPTSLLHNNVWGLIEDGEGNIWLQQKWGYQDLTG